MFKKDPRDAFPTIDKDNNGIPDAIENHYDLDGDGIVDGLEHLYDGNSNGIPDILEDE